MPRQHQTFKDIQQGAKFYMKRYCDGSESDSISMVKQNDEDAFSIEWGTSDIHPDQPCWIII